MSHTTNILLEFGFALNTTTAVVDVTLRLYLRGGNDGPKDGSCSDGRQPEKGAGIEENMQGGTGIDMWIMVRETKNDRGHEKGAAQR